VRWHRVFGGSEKAPEAEACESWLRRLDPTARLEFEADELGWYRAAGTGPAGKILIDRYLTREDSIRSELNSWAAWLESLGEHPRTVELMQQVITARQLFTVRSQTGAEPLCVDLCRWLGSQVEGIYQVDGCGFFGADGTLLVAEDG
jgi:hypothetical protein